MFVSQISMNAYAADCGCIDGGMLIPHGKLPHTTLRAVVEEYVKGGESRRFSKRGRTGCAVPRCVVKRFGC